ncbi:hypothetical protein KP509_1Z214400 [Ceratopteris richardii]|nr:hypothetical protein KP509_1Z214400 [Ceratopteris richardii]
MSRTERMAATVPTEIVNVLRKEVVLVSRPQGLLTEGNIKVIESDFTYTKPLHDENSLLLKIIYISLDPYMRIIMNEDSGLHGIPALELGKVILPKYPDISWITSIKGFAVQCLQWKIYIPLLVGTCDSIHIGITYDNANTLFVT